MSKVKNTTAAKILSYIPSRVKSIDYLMETLNISRESVYRRIRGDISFTFDEIAKLSVELGFSVDELIMQDAPSHIFFDLHVSKSQDPSEAYITQFHRYFQNILDLPDAKGIESTMITNIIPLEFIVLFNNLFKFAYYRKMHQFQESSLKYFYSNVALPEDLLYLQHISVERLKRAHNFTYIIDSNIFLNLIREIQYYYKRRLINDSEFDRFREELTGLIDMMESVAQTGFCNSNAKSAFYLSSLNIESGSRYAEINGTAQSQFFIDAIEPLTISNPNVCAIHKKWLDSMRKYSTLISMSNEILQVKYFNKQRSYIEELSENIKIISL